VTYPPRKYIFNTAPYTEDEARVPIDFAIDDLKMKNPKIGIITMPGSAGKSFLDGAKEQAKKYNLKIVGYYEVPSDSIDFSAPVIGLRKENVEIVLLYVVPPCANLVLKEAQKLLWRPLFFGGWPSSQDKIIELAGDAAEGMHAVRGFAMPTDKEVPGVKRVLEIAKKYHVGKEITDTYIYGWVNAIVMAEGLKRAGRDLTIEKLVKALESLKNFSTEGLCGPVTYSPTQRSSGAQLYIVKADVKNKQFALVAGWRWPKE
jgi:branched-chain amino acid transport system substrate-binding protein